jgi:oxygen-independent coproporphyrinogen-3 oxidase
MQLMEKNIGLYIHIPFCKSKCHYCDFNSFAGKSGLVEQYFKSLYAELNIYAETLKDCSINTVFIGGGTPSYVNAQYICATLECCREGFSLHQDAEISIETNPGTLTREKLSSYKASGINRLSIGLQAWQDRLLRSMGRIHSTSDFIENFSLAKESGFNNINVDLIFGLPSQTISDWDESLSNVIKLGATHLSCYGLKIEDGTIFGNRLKEGQLEQVDDELDRDMYYLAIEKLFQNGFRHYEISNFAKDGCECRHNMTYWKAEEYLGVGAGAHSYLNGQRFNNRCGIEEYISIVSGNELPIENVERIDVVASMSEFMILGLRLIEGISLSEFKSTFERDVYDVYGKQIDSLLKKGLVLCDGDRLRLTQTGLDLANMVFIEFL